MSTPSQPKSTQLESKTYRGYPSLLRVTVNDSAHGVLTTPAMQDATTQGVIYTQLIHRTNGCCQAGTPVTLATPKMTEVLAKRRQIDRYCVLL